MGQRIQVEETNVFGETAVFSTDRGLSGMDGLGFDDVEEARGSDRFPALLAVRIFETDDAVRRVYVASSEVVVTRAGGWEDASLASVRSQIEEFFLFYGS